MSVSCRRNACFVLAAVFVVQTRFRHMSFRLRKTHTYFLKMYLAYAKHLILKPPRPRRPGWGSNAVIQNAGSKTNIADVGSKSRCPVHAKLVFSKIIVKHASQKQYFQKRLNSQSSTPKLIECFVRTKRMFFSRRRFLAQTRFRHMSFRLRETHTYFLKMHLAYAKHLLIDGCLGCLG